MKIDGINISSLIKDTKKSLDNEKGLSTGFRSTLNLLLTIFVLLANRLGLNSQNSSKPPSADKNRKKTSKKGKGKRKAGGQNGHNGTTLKKTEEPDEVLKLKIDRRTLPKSDNYKCVGFESRQVFDIKIYQHVIEYQAECLENSSGKRFVATFPKGVKKATQYGAGIKSHAVYMSQYQLIPYERVREHFNDQLDLQLSAGSLFNFNNEAYEKLEDFEKWIKARLAGSDVLHVDETGINIDGKKIWLHNASNEKLVYFYPHANRGKPAMDEIGIIPQFMGVLCHDHWKSYYKFNCNHSLCNAHHLRELECAWEQDAQEWAKKMKSFLRSLNKKVEDAGGSLSLEKSAEVRLEYRKILTEADVECPPPDESERNGKRGRLKRSKSRNLLERLRDFEDDTLRFIDDINIPFTNNMSENDLRMTKVQQKISGCFRSLEGAKMFCRIRSYLLTCRRNGLTSSEGLTLLFKGESPSFMKDAE